MKKNSVIIVTCVVAFFIGFFVWSYYHPAPCPINLSSRLSSQDPMQFELDLIMQLSGRDITEEISLAEALNAFNQKYPDDSPLTEKEVVEAIRNWNREEHRVKDAVYALYNKVAEKHILPKGMYFSKIEENWEGEYAYNVDWKRLELRSLPLGQKNPDIGLGYSYTIRERYISKRPLARQEKKEMLEQQQFLINSPKS